MRYSITRRSPREGQTLMELIVAIFVILVGIVGTVTLAIMTLTIARESKHRVLSANLAREGIDVVRQIRDSNWLAAATWNTGLSVGNDYSAIPEFDPTAVLPSDTWTLNFDPSTIIFDDLNDDTTVVYRDGAVLRQDADYSGGTAQATAYRRIVRMNPICLSVLECTAGICTDGSSCTTTIGVQVLSSVRWVDHGRSQLVTVEERLYDWR